jgi:membrane protease YdiL (CAAX protease family)
MQDKENYPKPLEAFLIIIASFIFIVLITQSFLWLFLSDPSDINKNSFALKMLITFGEVGLIIVPVVYIKSRQLSYRKVFRWNSIPTPLYLWSFIIGLSLSVIGDELYRLINLIIPAPEFIGEIADALQISTIGDFFVLFLGAVIAAAFIEESIIRGFLQISLEKYQDVTRAVIYASLAWTIIHGMLYWAIQIFILGIFLGILAWRSNSILPSAIGHATNNAAALLFYNINQDKLAGIYLWGDHVSPLFIILALVGVTMGMKTFYKWYGNKPDLPYSAN